LWGDPQWHVGVDPASAEAQVRGWFYGLGVTCMRYRPAIRCRMVLGAA